MPLSSCLVVLCDGCINFLTCSEHQSSRDLTDLDEVYSRAYAMRCKRRFGDASRLEENVEGFLSGMICFILRENAARLLLNYCIAQTLKKYVPVIIAMPKIKLILNVYYYAMHVQCGLANTMLKDTSFSWNYHIPKVIINIMKCLCCPSQDSERKIVFCYAIAAGTEHSRS